MDGEGIRYNESYSFCIQRLDSVSFVLQTRTAIILGPRAARALDSDGHYSEAREKEKF
jgi:hypothetical protein